MRYPNGSSISVPFNGDRQVCFTEAGEVWLDGSVRDLKGMDRERFLSGTWADKS